MFVLRLTMGNPRSNRRSVSTTQPGLQVGVDLDLTD